MGLGHLLLYVGGNVVVGNRPEAEVIELFKGYGFDRVYHQRPDIGAAIIDLFQDLENGATQR
jgi:methylaspartate mutase sigma subunit